MHSLTITWLPTDNRQPRWLQTMWRWHRAQCVKNVLEALKDTMLRDIGISRGEIIGVAERIARAEDRS